MNKIIVFGVRNYEIDIFNKIINEYKKYSFTLVEQLLTNENINDAINYKIVIIRGNCFLNKESLSILKKNGLVYLLTRSVGYNHIDIKACNELKIIVCNVPNYSPRSIAEHALSLALSLHKKIIYITNNTKNFNLKTDHLMLNKTLNELTIGVIGTGNIGIEFARMCKSIGCNIIGYDIYKKDNISNLLEYKDFDDVIRSSDIISIHIPYKEENHHLFNKDVFNKMKKGSILINTSRGEIISSKDLLNALENNHLYGCALDVFEDENNLFFRNYSNKTKNDIFNRLVMLYPRVIITPHVASNTYEAIYNMIKISLENLDDLINNRECKNLIK